jgi:GDPmannose 4,6-dehydratase
LQQDYPDDYVIASGQSHSVREFLEIAFDHVGLNYKNFLEINDDFYRPSEEFVLCGDASKAKQHLGWQPQVSFEQLVKEMVDHDLKSSTSTD